MRKLDCEANWFRNLDFEDGKSNYFHGEQEEKDGMYGLASERDAAGAVEMRTERMAYGRLR